jgi:hypothetical protein
VLLENDWPRAHKQMDDFFSPKALTHVFREIESLDSKLRPGLVRDVGHDGQSVFFEHPRRKSRAVWVHDPSKTLDLFREQLFSPPMTQAFDAARLTHCGWPSSVR